MVLFDHPKLDQYCKMTNFAWLMDENFQDFEWACFSASAQHQNTHIPVGICHCVLIFVSLSRRFPFIYLTTNEFVFFNSVSWLSGSWDTILLFCYYNFFFTMYRFILYKFNRDFESWVVMEVDHLDCGKKKIIAKKRWWYLKHLPLVAVSLGLSQY